MAKKKDFKHNNPAAAFISNIGENHDQKEDAPIIETKTEKTVDKSEIKEPKETTGKLHSAQDVADYLGVTRRTLYNYIHDGKITGLKVGRTWKFTDQQIQDFLSNATQDNA